MTRAQVDISMLSIFRALVPVLLVFLVYLLGDVLIILCFGIVIASAVNPFVMWLEQRRVPRIAAVLILYLMVIALVVLLSSLIVPELTRDLSQLTSFVPQLTQNLSSSLDSVQENGRYFDVVAEIQNILESVSGYLQQFSRSALSLVVGAFGGVISFVAVIVISFYLAAMKGGVESFLEAVVPERYESYVIDLWRRAEAKMGLWFQGQLLLALIVGLLVYVGLSLLGVRFALLLAVLAMMLELVPMVGPILAAIPALGLAFLQGPQTALWVFALYAGVQQLENHVLLPIIMGKTTGMNPIVVILAILIGGQLAGIAGAILGVPVATVIVEILDDVARAKTSRKAT